MATWSGSGVGQWIGVFVAAWLVWAWVADRIMMNPRGEAGYGLGYWTLRAYTWFFHGLRIDGRENVPSTGPIVVVVNHSAGVDPILAQMAVAREIRWMMGRDMMLPAFAWVWDWLKVIPVDRASARGDMTALRLALRHLDTPDGIVGVFPEGAIARPRETIMPFAPGVGLLVAKSGAAVVPIVIDGTPEVSDAWGSLWTASRSRVRVMPTIRYEASTGAAEITKDLRERFASWTGWRLQ